jgi:hypothetical protein
VFFAIEATGSARTALLAACALFALSIIACAAFLTWMRRATLHDELKAKTKIQFWGRTVHGLFILQCSNYLIGVTL